MYKGEPTEGIEFYKLLIESEEFTSELGKVSLASGKLEAELMQFFNRNGIKENYKKASLGTLIKIGEKNKLFDSNMIISLNLISKQRNYLTHNIYALFTNLIDETILERKNLLDTDVLLYLDRVCQLNENLNGLADIIQRKTN